MDEYDAAVCRAKTVALDAASLARTKDFMVLHLDDEIVRYCDLTLSLFKCVPQHNSGDLTDS